ncbi:unnamed protein product [Rhizophagus irregularis]|nr:unnamed protein product [Rhizophagus irregularis]
MSEQYIEGKRSEESQKWFNEKYIGKKNIVIAKGKKLKLRGPLKIKDFEKLKKISLKKFELTNLEIIRCFQLDKVDLSELSMLKSLSVIECSKLTMENFSFNGLTNLNSLKISNYSQSTKIFKLSELPKLKSLSIIECSTLTTLDCSLTELASLEISHCPQLEKFDLSKLPKLTSLSVTKCPNITTLNYSTELTSLKISGSQLEEIDLSKLTKLTNLSVTDYQNLAKLDYSSIELTSLEINRCPQLTEIGSLKLSKLTSLSIIKCPKLLTGSTNSNSQIFDSSVLPKLKSLTVSECSFLTMLDYSLTELTSLEIINCSKIDLSKLPKLTRLSVTKCPNITKINYSTGLTSLKISGSQLEEIGLSKLTKLTSLSVIDCQKLTSLDCSSPELTSLKIINCSKLNKITDHFESKPKNLIVRGYSNLSMLDYSETGFNSLRIDGCSQLSQLNKDDLPKQITSLSVIDCLNLKKLDCSTGLTSLKISGCYRLENVGCSKLPKLTNLSVTDCLKLTKLNCSSNENLTELEVSDLTELDCSNTSIKNLGLNLCPYITKLYCFNTKLIDLDVSNCSKLEFIDCSQSNLTSLDTSYCPESIMVKPTELNIIREKKNIKNILVTGLTGGGKSTLANVLTDTDEFKESAYSVSETKDFRKKKFRWKGHNFCVVDTIGAADTKLGLKDVLYKIANGTYAMPEGISQVLFVVDGRFTKEEINTFNMIKDSILDAKILGYVTLVRTKFGNFRSKDECEKDICKMREESETIAEIVSLCNGVIHVDNPPINIEKIDDDGDEYVAQIKINKNVRTKSRENLLSYLENVRPVQKNEYLKLSKWDKLNVNIRNYVKNKKTNPEFEAYYKESCPIL